MSVGDSEFRSSYNGVSWLKWILKKPVHFYLISMMLLKFLKPTGGKKMDL